MKTVLWTKIDFSIRKNADFKVFGVYCVRIVAPSNKPIPIKRIGGIDPSGQIYIGRSGLSNQNSRRTIANRLYEFQRPNHSGGQLYEKMKKVLRGKPFMNHHLEATATIFPNSRIKNAEAKLLEKLFSRLWRMASLQLSKSLTRCRC